MDSKESLPFLNIDLMNRIFSANLFELNRIKSEIENDLKLKESEKVIYLNWIQERKVELNSLVNKRKI